MKILAALLAVIVEALNTAFPRPPAPSPPAPPAEETPSPDPGPAVEPLVETVTSFEDEQGELLGTFEATCYALTGTTASGAPAGPGSIAVDRRVIPLGTRLVVEGYGPGDARDTGGAIKGNRVDVWLSTVAACRAWGRRSVRVWVAP